MAFLLPGIIHVNSKPIVKKGDGPFALVLSPTRESISYADIIIESKIWKIL